MARPDAARLRRSTPRGLRLFRCLNSMWIWRNGTTCSKSWRTCRRKLKRSEIEQGASAAGKDLELKARKLKEFKGLQLRSESL